MLNHKPGPKGWGTELIIDIPLNCCCKPWLECHLTGITMTLTTQTNGREEGAPVQQGPELSWLWCPVTPCNTPPPLSQMTTRIDGTQSHRLNKLNGPFVDILLTSCWGGSKTKGTLSLYYIKWKIITSNGKRVVVNEIILSSMAPEHNVNARK